MYKPNFENLYNRHRCELLSVLEKYAPSNGGVMLDHVQSDIIRLLDGTDFYEAPASTRYHGAYPGGLFQHSMAVMQLLIEWTELGILTWKRKCSPVIVGLLHDYTKVGKYTLKCKCTQPITRPLEFAYADRETYFGGHGIDSLCKIALRMTLTEEEAHCIRFHMGPYEKDEWDIYNLAISKYPNVLWTHQADMVAAKDLKK